MKDIIKQHLGLSHVSITAIETQTDGSIEIAVKSTLKEGLTEEQVKGIINRFRQSQESRC
uniref:Uncharacterized protein n=1 Tax=uncultured Thiotrichaceae bacterium TaxID=298394 RepID=A0A6S6RVW5_9GAMM|nr:MAG: Unknown protein [uncultured Thiotrichaceae bacterium]